jgi:phage shock protein PspC (stress-responsive transcriptional regulator)
MSVRQIVMILIGNLMVAAAGLLSMSPDARAVLQILALVVLVVMSLCAFAECQLLRRLNYAWAGWAAVFVALMQEPSMRTGALLAVGWALTQMTFLLAVLLTDKMERLERQRFVVGVSRGIVQRLPQHAGLMQVLLLLFSCVPGSAFFFIEDMGVEALLHHSWVAVGIMLGSNALIAIALWSGCTEIFLGRHTTEEGRQTESGLLPYRAAIAVLLGLNLMPFLWAH